MREDIIRFIALNLDTRDKRYMFLRLEFRTMVPRIDLEGVPNHIASEIYQEFKRSGLVKELAMVLNSKLDAKIKVEL